MEYPWNAHAKLIIPSELWNGVCDAKGRNLFELVLLEMCASSVKNQFGFLYFSFFFILISCNNNDEPERNIEKFARCFVMCTHSILFSPFLISINKFTILFSIWSMKLSTLSRGNRTAFKWEFEYFVRDRRQTNGCRRSYVRYIQLGEFTLATDCLHLSDVYSPSNTNHLTYTAKIAFKTIEKTKVGKIQTKRFNERSIFIVSSWIAQQTVTY